MLIIDLYQTDRDRQTHTSLWRGGRGGGRGPEWGVRLGLGGQLREGSAINDREVGVRGDNTPE